MDPSVIKDLIQAVGEIDSRHSQPRDPLGILPEAQCFVKQAAPVEDFTIYARARGAFGNDDRHDLFLAFAQS